MIQNYLKRLGALALVLSGGFLATSEVKAQAPLVAYTFPGSTGLEDSLAADAQPANATFYKAKRGSAIVASTGAGYLTANTWPIAFNANAYFSFAGRPNTGYNLNLNAVALSLRHSSTGAAIFEIRSSLDNYTAILKTITVPSTTTSDVRDSLVLSPAFTGLTSKVEFRVFGYGGTGAATGSARIDNIKIYGTTTPTGTSTTPTVNFASATSSVAENVTGGTLSIPVSITNPSTTAATTVNVTVATAGGTATNPADYTITTGTLTFPAASTANQNAILTIVNDALIEGSETINLTLSGISTGAAIGANNTHTVTIVDDEIAPTVAFGTPNSKTVLENAGAVTIPVTLSSASTTPVTVQVALATAPGTATLASDYTFAPQTVTFAAGSTTQNATLTVINDKIIEGNETVLLVLQTPTGANLSTTNANYTVTIVSDDAVPLYTVAQVTNNTPVTLVADSLNKKVSVRGTLYGNNQRAAGLQLELIDATGGIDLFRSTYPTTASTAFPIPAPIEGDSVQAWGTITQFNGLTELNLDSIHVLGTNHPLRAPKVLSGPQNETHESELVKTALPVTLVTPSQWKTTGSSFNVDVTNGTDTYQVRILTTSNIFGTPAPAGPFYLTATGGQNDTSSPFDAAYQLIPRRLTDIQIVSGVAEELANAISIYPNPVKNVLNLNLSALASKKATVTVVNSLGQEIATVPANATSINVAKFPAGVYTLKIATSELVVVKRFVKIN